MTQETHKHTEYLETVSRNFGEKIKLVIPWKLFRVTA